MSAPAPHDEIQVDHLPAPVRSLRISVVTETYPPEVNGVARTLASLVEGLRERNHDLQLIRPAQKAESAGAGDAGFHEVLMRGLPIPRYPRLRMGLVSKGTLVKLWSHRRPDVVHIATEGPMGWSALQAARQLKLPVCSDFRTNFHAYSKHYGVGWLHKPIMGYLRKFHNLTGCTMVPDAGLRQNLQDYGFHNVVVVARGVDTALFNPARRSAALRAAWGLAPQDLAVINVGRMAPEKNLATVMDAFEAIRQVQPRARLVLVGDGPSLPELRQRCPDAIFAGMRHGEELATHYASGDLFLFPSTSETYGNVTAEAMASGLAVLAYDYAAAHQLIRSGHNGVLAPLGSTADFVGRAARLAAAPEVIADISRGACASRSSMGWGRIVDQVESAYHALIAQRPLPVALMGELSRRAQPA